MDSRIRAQIAYYMPSLVRMREWTRLFTIAKDGVSYTTFYENLKDRDNTVILIKDNKGKIFGAYCSEYWRKAMHFYGLGDSFVFTFD
jgi:TLD